MGQLIIDLNKINDDVIPQLSHSRICLNNASSNINYLIKELPSDFPSRQTVLNIISNVDFELREDISSVIEFYKSKVSNISGNESEYKNKLYRFSPISQRILSDSSKNHINYTLEPSSFESRLSGLEEDIKRYKREGYDEKASELEQKKKALEFIYEEVSKGNKKYFNEEQVIKEYLKQEVFAKTNSDSDFRDFYKLDEKVYYAIALYPKACDDELLSFISAKTYTEQKLNDILNINSEKNDILMQNLWQGDPLSLDYKEWPMMYMALLAETDVTFEKKLQDYLYSKGFYVENNFLSLWHDYIKVLSDEELNNYFELFDKDCEAADVYLHELNADEKVRIYNGGYYSVQLNTAYIPVREDIFTYAKGIESRLLKEKVGYERPDSKINELSSTILMCNQISFGVEYNRYLDCNANEDFYKYVYREVNFTNQTYKKYNDIDNFSTDYEKIAYYMTEDERKCYIYKLNKYGQENADNYLLFLKGTLRERCGKELAEAKLASFIVDYKTNENGQQIPVYDYDGVLEQLKLFGIGTVDGIRTFGQGFVNAFAADGEKSTFDYEKIHILMLLASNDEGAGIFNDAFGYELGSSIGNMLPSIAVSMAAGTIASMAPESVVVLTPLLGKLGLVTMGVSTYGNTKEELLQQGIDKYRANFRALLGALSEVGLEHFLGSIPGLSKLEESSKWISKVLAEGAEESTQCIVDALFDTVVLGEEFSIDFDELVKSGIMGMFSSGIINAPKSLHVTANGVITKIKIGDLSDIYKYTDPMKIFDSNYNEAVKKSMVEYNKGNLIQAAEIMKNAGYLDVADSILASDINVEIIDTDLDINNAGKNVDGINNVNNEIADVIEKSDVTNYLENTEPFDNNFNKDYFLEKLLPIIEKLENIQLAKPVFEDAINRALSIAKKSGNYDVVNMLENLSKIKVRVGYTNRDRSFANNRKINLTSSVIRIGVETTVYHELGHVLHAVINDSNIPKNYMNVKNSAINHFEFNPHITSNLFDFIISQRNKAIMKASAYFDKNLSDDVYKKFLSVDSKDIIVALKLIDETGTKIGKFTIQEQFDNYRNSYINKGSDKIMRNWGIGSMSDIICSIYNGRAKFLNFNTNSIFVLPYTHDKTYYTEVRKNGKFKRYKTLTEINKTSFHEQMADYIALKLSNNQECIHLLYNALGSDWKMMMEENYNNIINYFKQ